MQKPLKNFPYRKHSISNQARSKKLLLSLLGLLLVWATSAYAQDKSTIRIGFPHFPPYSINEAKQIPAGKNKYCSYEAYQGHGIDVDFLIAVLDEADLKHELSFVPQARLSKGLDNIDLDATASVFYSEIDGEPKYRYVLYDIGGATIFLAEDLIAPQLNDFDAIKRVQLGVVRGEYFHNKEIHDWVRNKPNPNVMIANNYEQLFSMLASKRVAAIAANDVLGEYMLNEKDLKQIDIAPFKIPYGTNPKSDGIYIAMSKKLIPAHVRRIEAATALLLSTEKLSCIKEIYGVHTPSNSKLVVRLMKAVNITE